MQARTASNAVEWYTFLRNLLGWQRASELQVNIPDMSLSVRIANPFERLEASQNEVQHAKDTEEALLKTMQEEQAVASNIVRKCLTELADSPEWKDVLDSWTKDQRIGLAWRRYDRLEWIHGANERKMYGTIAMLKSHELELRPKTHYPTTVVTRKKQKTLTEPVPVEGFLIRLTGQQGRNKRLGLMYHKQLYFASHDQYLVFSRPTKTTPPPPPKMPASETAAVPGAEAIKANIPSSWAVNPFPVEADQIRWLAEGHSGTPETRRLHEEDAADEEQRKWQNLLNSDGYINMGDILKVRKAKLGASPVDEDLEEGSDVDFDDEVDDSPRDDGATKEVDLDRTFELVMKNGLIIRLQVSNLRLCCVMMLTSNTVCGQRATKRMDQASSCSRQVLEEPHSFRHCSLQVHTQSQSQRSQHRRGSRSICWSICPQMGSHSVICLSTPLQHMRYRKLPKHSHERHALSQATHPYTIYTLQCHTDRRYSSHVP